MTQENELLCFAIFVIRQFQSFVNSIEFNIIKI